MFVNCGITVHWPFLFMYRLSFAGLYNDVQTCHVYSAVWQLAALKIASFLCVEIIDKYTLALHPINFNENVPNNFTGYIISF